MELFSSRISSVSNGNIPFEALQDRFRKNFGHMPHSLFEIELVPVCRDDPRTFLPSVL